ncbi:MAG: hypothetical protein ACFFE2_10530 [Candidatus Thorarchaeota archaeon]
MFIGHYGIAFILKKFAPKISLGVLFIAVQLVDIAFFILVPLGIEHLRIIPGFTEASPFDLYDYPITHSLLGAFVWAIGTYVLVRFFPLWSSTDTAYRQRVALVLSAAVFSHFLLDVIVHTPDLLLLPGFDLSIGLGLWNSILVTVVAELAVLLVGCWIYLRSTSSGSTLVGKYGMYVFIIALVVITVITPFTMYPDALAAAMMAEFMYVVLTLAAWWLDGKRYATVDQVQP